MNQLTAKNWHKAQTFMQQQARPLERALFAYYFADGAKEAILQALAAFQNEDGGFGQALEPDFRIPDSSVLATTVALQILWQLEIGPDNPLVQGAMRFLVNNYDAQHNAWPFIPPHESQYPHALWWQYNPDVSNYLDNPRSEIARYYLDYAALVPEGQPQALLRAVVQRLAGLKELEFHALLCYLRLITTRTLDDDTRQQIITYLEPIIKASVVTDSEEWTDYNLKPLGVVSQPDSPFIHLFPEAVESNLDFELTHQGADGAWSPAWSWGPNFSAVWPQARRDWQGVLTLNTLKTLRSFGRLASDQPPAGSLP